jgi:hypothetical protein
MGVNIGYGSTGREILCEGRTEEIEKKATL